MPFIKDWEETRADKEVQPMTNADRIRAMSDEELAKAIGILTYNDLCLNPCADICEGCPFSSFCANCIEGHELEWLQQPAEAHP